LLLDLHKIIDYQNECNHRTEEYFGRYCSLCY